MVHKTLTLGLAVAATVALAGPAQASVIDTDRPELNGTGYDFGNGTFVAGSPTRGGRLKFDLSDGRIEPRLTGTLHVKDADGTCARVKLAYRDRSDDALTDPAYSPTKCVDDDHHHEYSVDLDSYADNAIDNVKISLQKKTASGWSTVESETYPVDTSDDKVKITADGVDFGDLSFDLGAPLGHGDMSWKLDGVDVAPRLLGGLHLNNSSGVCARINLRYYTQAGAFLTKRADDEMCAQDNGHHSRIIDFSPHASNKIAEVKVQLQTQASNGSWNVAGSRTVSIAEKRGHGKHAARASTGFPDLARADTWSN
jgi:hypothetical protein